MLLSCSLPDACRLEDLVPPGCWHCLGDAQLARAISNPDFLEKLRAGKRVGQFQGPLSGVRVARSGFQVWGLGLKAPQLTAVAEDEGGRQPGSSLLSRLLLPAPIACRLPEA